MVPKRMVIWKKRRLFLKTLVIPWSANKKEETETVREIIHYVANKFT